MKKGLIHIYCGDGKGKTTAAFGLALRALGRNFRVLPVQFCKDGTSGELEALRSSGLDFTFLEGFKPSGSKREEDKNTCARFTSYDSDVQESFDRAVNISSNYDMLILDELTWGIFHGAVSLESVLEFLDNKPEGLEVVITGRKPHKMLVERADYVSQIDCVKHPYEQGVPARKGIEL